MTDHDGRHDVDDLHGRWHLRNERLVGRRQGSTAWETVDAAGTLLPLTDGGETWETN